MSKHTPGPWVVVYYKNGHPYQIDAPNGSKGKGGITPIITRWGGISFPSSDEGKANARLIAAAPETAAERDKLKEVNAELLAALRAMLSVCGCGTALDCSVCNSARAAIAKAEGKSSDGGRMNEAAIGEAVS